MSRKNPEVYLDLLAGIDYCRTHDEDCKETRSVIDNLDQEHEATIDISSQVYQQWEDCVLNIQSILKKLKKKSNEYYIERDDDGDEFVSEVVNREYLNSALSFNIPAEYEEELEMTREYISENGLNEYRKYLKTHLRNVSAAHSKLDQIASRYDAASADRIWARAKFESICESEMHLKSLLDAHYWCKSGGDLVLIREGDRTGYESDQVRKRY